jgi:hypothetical protein
LDSFYQPFGITNRVPLSLYLNESTPFPTLLELIQVWPKLPEHVKGDIGVLAKPYRHEKTKSKTPI